MSTNHFSTEAPWCSNHHHQQHMMESSSKPSSRSPKNPSIFSNSHPMNFTNNPTLSLNLNHEANHNNDTSNEDLEEQITDERGGREEQFMAIKDFMFEKPLTPSDVGKLNRLVIPKQHAEKYFPLDGNINNTINNNNNINSNCNESGSEKGLLLSFEDELGKSYRFRYSYWNSSQSYVLTKGWSRFVKEKKLEAGDVVLFERHRFEWDRFFIGWRRRGTPATYGGGGLNHMLQSFQHQHLYQPDHAGLNVQNQTGSASSSTSQPKTLRLFGVNMECKTDDVESEPDTPDGTTIASQGSGLYQYYHHQDQQYNYSKLNAYHNNHFAQ